jgi:hypothetical protein
MDGTLTHDDAFPATRSSAAEEGRESLGRQMLSKVPEVTIYLDHQGHVHHRG